MTSPLPAHQTKHLQELLYPLPTGESVRIVQDNSTADSTGRTVWLGAQVLSVYLYSLLGIQKAGKRKTALDLGSGTGLLAIALSRLGFDVLATDLPLLQPLLSTNLARNRSYGFDAPILQFRSLDWFVDPAQWDFTSTSGVTPSPISPTADESERLLLPPFDLIVTSDSIYDSALIQPLLRTLHRASSPPYSPRSSPPTIYLALEARDPLLISSFFESARGADWKFKCSQVDEARLDKLIGHHPGGLGWEKEDWEGVQVWKMKLARGNSTPSK